MNKSLKNSTLWYSLFILPVLISGCAEIDSENIRTSGFYTEIEVVAENDRTTVHADLSTDRALDADSIKLSAGDRLSATMSGQTISLVEAGTGYEGEFNQSGDGALVTVSLRRDSGTDAPGSTVNVPQLFQITAPDQAATFNAGDSITVVWSPNDPANLVSVNYFLNCQVTGANGLPTGAAFGRSFEVVDSGTHTTTINTILNTFGSQDDLISGVACPMTVSVTRTIEGSLDAALTKGGDIRAIREESVVVNAIP
ncbi:MAG: hypothetical protein AAF404_16260 [Pseudomonadota bacterium]